MALSDFLKPHRPTRRSGKGPASAPPSLGAGDEYAKESGRVKGYPTRPTYPHETHSSRSSHRAADHGTRHLEDLVLEDLPGGIVG